MKATLLVVGILCIIVGFGAHYVFVGFSEIFVSTIMFIGGMMVMGLGVIVGRLDDMIAQNALVLPGERAFFVSHVKVRKPHLPKSNDATLVLTDVRLIMKHSFKNISFYLSDIQAIEKADNEVVSTKVWSLQDSPRSQRDLLLIKYHDKDYVFGMLGDDRDRLMKLLARNTKAAQDEQPTFE